jgi:thioredoxin-dependent adenylylsulfate APS reductase
VFTIDTGRLPPETYELIDRVRERYGIEVEVFCPDQNELSQMVTRYGINPFYRSISLRLLCCEVRKVNPLNRALSNLDAWITGLRRSQSQTRESLSRVELDRDHGNILKVNPLADWSDERVWEYIRAHDLPYNRLYDQGFTSIGCAPCTRAVTPGEDERAGRWWWETGMPKECGIHLKLRRDTEE